VYTDQRVPPNDDIVALLNNPQQSSPRTLLSGQTWGKSSMTGVSNSFT
jgi:hypothetical protein